MKTDPPLPARILLVNFNAYDQPYPVYPLGLAYIEAALRLDGHVTEIWDVVPPGESLEQAVVRFQPDFIGLSMRNIDNAQSHNPRSFTLDLLDCVARLRAISTVPLILGGSGFSIFPEEIFGHSGVDFGIVGEGETAIRRLVRALRGGGEALGEIAGLMFRGADGAVVKVAGLNGVAAFSEIPHHDPVRLLAYANEGSPIGLQTQRGCPLNCCYCTYPLIEGKRSRFRPAGEVAKELARLAEAGLRQVFFVDSVFNTNNNHVVEVCEAILRADVKINWECFLRPSNGITRELLELMQRAGLNHIEFGSDSLSDPVLRHYGKSFQFEEIRRVSELAGDLKIRHTHFIIFGGPGETPETMEESIARSATLPKAMFFATIGMRVYPGTPLWQIVTSNRPAEVAGDYLLEPRFYLEPPMDVAGLHARLMEVQQSTSNWMVGDPPQAFVETLAKLRRRRQGRNDNMWDYVELMQRLASGRQGAIPGRATNPDNKP